MGQRSQIYIMAKDVDCGTVDKPDIKSDLLVANYYQWNYGERMVSRARGIMEHLQYYKENDYLDFFLNSNFDNSYKIKLSRIADTNFDMRDVAISLDILTEIEQYAEWVKDRDPDFKVTSEYFKNGVFNNQDNNDGQLYIQVSPTEIKYAFAEIGENKPMTASEYLEWDDCDGSFLPKEDKEILKQNVSFINENAILMTSEELEAFKNYDFPFKKAFLEKHGEQIAEKAKEKPSKTVERD